MTAAISASPSVQSRIGHFLLHLHYGEMCLPMCIGFALGDAPYLRAAGSFGYSDPFAQLPELSVLVVTVAMTAPMTAWMLYCGMPRRATAEMSAAMPRPGGCAARIRRARCRAQRRAGLAGARPDDAGDARSHAHPTRPLHRTSRTQARAARIAASRPASTRDRRRPERLARTRTRSPRRLPALRE
jgi:hypothetical protein